MKHLVTLLFAVGFLTSCQPPASSRSKDIFQQDLSGSGNERRRPAKTDEMYWTISMGGCTGHLISPDLMMSAAHCSPKAGARYKSGTAIAKKASADITVQSVVESNAALDYAIMRIRWNSGTMPSTQKFPPLLAHQSSTLKLSGSDIEDGDLLYTVGFPTDKSSTWGAVYSQGFGKQESDKMLVYNIGIINGNSGGGVWRKSDGMLVSLTNGGSRNFGDSGWSGADSQDPDHWNHGVAMWNVYRASSTIRDVFPNGRNRFATADTSIPRELFIALDASDATDAKASLLVSTLSQGTTIVLCQTLADCESGGPSRVETTEGSAIEGRRVVRTKVPVALVNQGVWYAVELDASNNVVLKKSIRLKAN